MQFQFKASDYEIYKLDDLKKRWLKSEDWLEIVRQQAVIDTFEVTRIGLSTENRAINSYKWGKGKKRILLWTQMHGNEPTATMALADLFGFLSASDDYDSYRSRLSKKLSLLFIPFLNPDGAWYFTRHNSLGIDLNRDARSQQAMEMRVFMNTLKEFQPHWAFNLHDQRNIFSVGNPPKPATISFLSASYEQSRRLNTARSKAMKLISGLTELTEEHIPGQIGRYTDEYYPRALGEFFHGQGIPCVLIESGADYNDYYRDTARKLNFLMLLRAFELIAADRVDAYTEESYYRIPENEKNMLDLIVRSNQLNLNEEIMAFDLGFLIKEVPDPERQSLEKIYQLAEIGDLSMHRGLEELKGGSISDVKALKPERAAHFSLTLKDGSKLTFNQGKRIS